MGNIALGKLSKFAVYVCSNITVEVWTILAMHACNEIAIGSCSNSDVFACSKITMSVAALQLMPLVKLLWECLAFLLSKLVAILLLNEIAYR